MDLCVTAWSRFESQLVYCPLIENPKDYIADTVDLTRDHDARAYWLTCFEESLPKFTDRAIASQAQSPDVNQRADRLDLLFYLKILKSKS